jgi:hypothetical protein
MSYSPTIKVYYSRGSVQSTAAEDPTNSFGPSLADPNTCCDITTESGCGINTITKFGLTDNYRLLPAPIISIRPEIYYANDTPIGYTYIIDLDGYATSIDLNKNIIPTGIADSFEKTLGAIQKVKNIFSFNNGILTILETTNNANEFDKVIMRASGCIIRALNIEANNNNHWVNYAKYKITLEANETSFVSCSGTGQIFGCENGTPKPLPSGIINSDSPSLIDMVKYKVKSFNDSWNFALNNNIYNIYNLTDDDSGNIFNLNNNYFDIEYTVTANGKHYTNFKSDSEIYVMPAWEQAKNFCQDRLYKVVNRLTENLLTINDTNEAQELFAARSGNALDGILYSPTGISDSFNSSVPSGMSGSGISVFGIYNESVSCNTSESDGSFSATYKAIVKKKNVLDNDKIKSDTITNITTSRQVSDDGKNREVSVTVNGSVQGLVEGGIIRSSGVLYLPGSGEIFKTNPSYPSGRYEAALIGYNSIASKSGLIDGLAKALSITYSGLNVDSECDELQSEDALGKVPPAISHSVSHDYFNGTINFTTNYNSKNGCKGDSRLTSFIITIDDPIPRIAEFVIPGRKSGPIIQRIGTDTPRYITYNIEGYEHGTGCGDPKSIIESICSNGINLPKNSGFPLKMIFDDTMKKGMKLIDNKYSYNRTDGSFSVVRKYLSYNYNTGLNAMGVNNPGRFNTTDYETTDEA